jgi:SnoaL-like protein
MGKRECGSVTTPAAPRAAAQRGANGTSDRCCFGGNSALAAALLLSSRAELSVGTGDTGFMASANVDLVRSICAPWQRGDFSSVEWAHPEIEYVIADGPSPGRWTGLAGLAEGWRDFLSAWEEFGGEAEEYRELDDERVMVLYRWSGRGKASGLELGQMQTKGANVFQVRGGKVTRVVHYIEHERALADLGLDPEAGSPRS